MYEKELVKVLGFSPKDKTADVYHKTYTAGYIIEIDFENSAINYGKEITSGSKTTQNFSQAENFVVLECVDRLLTKGYKAKDITLEKVFPSGHGHSGRLDIFIKNGKKPFLMIECKTSGKEFKRELANIQKNGGQLFTYFQNDTNTDYLMLYSSCVLNGEIRYNSEIIKIEDSYRTAGNVEDVYNRWNKITNKNGIFEEWIEPYRFQNKLLTKKDLQPLEESDSGFIFNSFASILRKHSVSDKPNAFNKIFNLFIAKIYDEDRPDDEELAFQWMEGKDDPVEFQIRLINLHKAGIFHFLEKEIAGISNSDFNAKDAEDLKRLKKERLKFDKIFDIKEVFDDDSFDDNFRVLKEVVQLLEKYQIRYPRRQRHLSDFFERLLTTGLKQEAGQYFTPVPIARFIVRSLPLRAMLETFAGRQEGRLPAAIDFAAGSGHFLTEILETYQNIIDGLDLSHYPPSVKKRFMAWSKNGDPYSWATRYVYGIEKDYRLVKVAKVGCYFYGDGLAKVFHADGLDSFSSSRIYDELLKQNAQHPQFDIVVSNPPYSVDAFRSDLRSKDAEDDFTLYPCLTDKSSEIECLFVERAAQLLKEGGVGGIILPSSLLSNAGIYTKTREIILQKFEIIAIAALGSNTFMATGTNTVILFLKRRKDVVVKNIKEGIAVFLASLKDITIGGVENAAAKYAHAVWNVSTADYITMHKKEPNGAVTETALYKEYYKSYPKKEIYFNDDTLPTALDKMREKYEEAVKKYWENIIAVETEKLFYFILTYPQKTVLIKTGEKDAEKRFLGYEFSNRRGYEGIHPMERGKTIEECTRLFDDERFDNPEKASTYIYKAFSGDYDYPVHGSLKENITRVCLADMLVFDRKDFDIAISTTVKKKRIVESKWEVVQIGDIADTQYGFTDKAIDHGEIRYLRITDLADDGSINLTNEAKFINPDEETKKQYLLKDNDIVIARSGSVGKSAIFKTNKYNNMIFASYLIRLQVKKNKILPYYLFYYTKTAMYWDQVEVNSIAAAQPNLNAEKIKNFKIPLPPLDIHEKIVAEIAALEEKEKNMADRIASIRKDISDLFLSASNAKFEKLENIAVMLKRGKSAKYGNSKIQIIKSGQARGYREFDFSERYFAGENLTPDERKLQKGDILINSTGVGTAGRVTLFNLDGDFAADSHITILRLDENIADPVFVMYVLAEYIGFKNIEAMAQGQSGQIELSLSIVQNINIPLPSLSEQQKITAEIERLEREIQNLQKKQKQTISQKELCLRNYL
jgi:type I restriction enzyme M protein